MFFFFNEHPHIALIGDIKKSRGLEDRRHVQEKLRKTLDKINKKHPRDISAKFMITLGDEFQGLLSNGNNVMNIIEEIQMEMYPVEIRFGVGVGAITTDINPEMAIGADGPGFYKARQAMNYLKQNENKNKKQIADIRIEVDGENEVTTTLLNTILQLLAVLKNNWTERQQQIIWDTLKYQESQAKIAERLEVSQSSVQRGLTSGNYYAYIDAINTISEVLKEIGKKDV